MIISTDARRRAPAAGLLLCLGLSVLLLTAWCSCARSGRPKLFVIGLDGATWDLLEPWIEAGDLPNLKAFRDGAAWGTMNSVIPYLSPPAWTTAVTGVNPGRHGIYDFQRRLPGQNVIVTETAKSRRSPPLWNLLKGTGKKVAIINIPMTDPPDEVDGVMVAGLPHLDQVGYAWPPELEKRCQQMGYLLDDMEMKLPPGKEAEVLTRIRTARDKRWQLAKQLYQEGDYDLFWLTFTGTDRVQHLFWKFDDPENAEYSPEGAAKFGGTMHRFWMEQDKILGEIFATIKPNTWTLILSDHGFGPIRRELRVGSWLRSPEASLDEGEIEDIFSLDKNDAARLYIKEPGRDPGGRRNPAERAALQSKVSAGLVATVDPATGKKPVEAIYPQDKVFVGKWAEKGPNLSVLPSYGYFISLGDMDTGYKLPTYGNVLMTLSGWHRMNGIYLLRGPGARSGHLDASVSLLDVTPTCLYLLGRPLPEDFDGKIMNPVLQDSWVRGHKAIYQGRLSEEDRPLTPEEQRALKNLPYIGG